MRMEALIRQLVFEHGFRVRIMKAAEDSKDNGYGQSVDSKQGSTGDLKHGDNLIGKINNLVTTDLANIVEARDFLSLGTHIYSFMGFFFFLDFLFYSVLLAPLVIIICLVFLYQVLGWRYVFVISHLYIRDVHISQSSFVGFAVILLLLPVPGYLGTKMQHIQSEKMKMVCNPLSISSFSHNHILI